MAQINTAAAGQPADHGAATAPASHHPSYYARKCVDCALHVKVYEGSSGQTHYLCGRPGIPRCLVTNMPAVRCLQERGQVWRRDGTHAFQSDDPCGENGTHFVPRIKPQVQQAAP